MPSIEQIPFAAVLLIFAAAAVVIGIVGLRLTDLADRLADRTALGEAVVGGALLGATTSLSGAVTSAAAASLDRPELAVSNAIGGIAAQTAFLAIADLVYRKANLEHAAASIENLSQSALLLLLLNLPLLAIALPEASALGVHPVSLALVAAYVGGLNLTASIRRRPMWTPRETSDTRRDAPDDVEGARGGMTSLMLRFAGFAATIGVAGWALAETGVRIADESGLRQTVVGALLTATITSMPELVTTIAAVRRGALQLAVGGIIGGNSFDVLFLALSDATYRQGSIYHATSDVLVFWLGVGMLQTVVLLLGLLARQQRGVGGIGFESAGVLTIYIAAALATAGGL